MFPKKIIHKTIHGSGPVDSNDSFGSPGGGGGGGGGGGAGGAGPLAPHSVIEPGQDLSGTPFATNQQPPPPPPAFLLGGKEKFDKKQFLKKYLYFLLSFQLKQTVLWIRTFILRLPPQTTLHHRQARGRKPPRRRRPPELGLVQPRPLPPRPPLWATLRHRGTSHRRTTSDLSCLLQHSSFSTL